MEVDGAEGRILRGTARKPEAEDDDEFMPEKESRAIITEREAGTEEAEDIIVRGDQKQRGRDGWKESKKEEEGCRSWWSEGNRKS